MTAQKVGRAARQAWTCLAIVGTLALGGTPSWAQADSYRLLSNALIGPKTAYVPLESELVCGRTAQVAPSDTGRDALIIYDIVSPSRTLGGVVDPGKRREELLGSGQSVAANLILWSDDNHASTVWRGSSSLAGGYNTPVAVHWIPDTRIALVQIMNMPGPINKDVVPDGGFKYTVTYLRVNGATGKTQTLLSGVDQDERLMMSPTQPRGILLAKDGKSYRPITVNGVAPSIPISGSLTVAEKDTLFWYAWMNDGKTLRGNFTRTADDGKRTRNTVLLDTTTGTLTDAAGTKLTPAQFGSADAVTPFVVQRSQETLTRDGVKTDVNPLWLQARDKDVTGRTLIAADSDPNFQPIVLTNSVLYRNGGSIYAVPILKADIAEFLARRKEAQKAETMQRAKQLGLAMMMYAQDWDENFPPVGSNLKDIVRPYVKNDTIFQNPVTGQNGFTPAYTNTALSSFETPATTPLGYFAGPDGVAVIFADGHVKWQDNPPKP